jgi:hypothetical protein
VDNNKFVAGFVVEFIRMTDLTIEELKEELRYFYACRDERKGYLYLLEQLLSALQNVANLQEALREIIICVWADEFRNADAKLDAIDKHAEQSLKRSEYSEGGK